MKLVACTLKNVETYVELDPSDTVETLALKIEASMSNMAASKLRLIHAGKILKREQKISDYADIKDGDKIIVLVSKQLEPAPISKHPNTSDSANSAVTAPASASAPISDNLPNSTGALNCDFNAMLTGEELEKAISGIVEMGFDIEAAKAAMGAAFNNPNRAIEILMNQEQGESMQHDQAGEDVLDEQAGQTDQVMTGALDELRQHPLFEQMRAIVRSNPQTLPQILSLIGQSDPSLLQAITENQEEFIQLLSEPSPDAQEGLSAVNSITLTQEEMESVTRLEGLGFSRPAAIEAFLACDKNEELAANYLFENVADYISDADN